MQRKVDQLDLQTQRRVLTDLAGAWTGTAADAAVARGNKNLEQLSGLRSRLENIQIALKSGEANLTPLRTEILNVSTQAMSLGATVSDDGTVTASGSSKLMTPKLADGDGLGDLRQAQGGQRPVRPSRARHCSAAPPPTMSCSWVRRGWRPTQCSSSAKPHRGICT